MFKLLYAGLIAVFAGSLIFVGAREGLFSSANRSGLTADFKLVSEIPINGRTKQDENNPKAATAKQKTAEIIPVVKSSGQVGVAKVVEPAPNPIPAPVFAPVVPTKVVLPSPSIESSPQPNPAPNPVFSPVPPTQIVLPEPPPVQEPTPAPVADPTPNPIPDPDPEPTPTPDPEPAPAPTPEPAPEPIRIEIYAIQTGTTVGGANDEFVKLYNPTNSEIDLGGWALKKTSSTGSFSNLVSVAAFTGKIAARGYFLVAHSGYNGLDPVDLRYSANSNNLSYVNNAVILYAADESVMDNVSWGDPGIPKDVIWTRE